MEADARTDKAPAAWPGDGRPARDPLISPCGDAHALACQLAVLIGRSAGSRMAGASLRRLFARSPHLETTRRG